MPEPAANPEPAATAETTVAFQTKAPFSTYWLSLEHAAGAPPAALLAELAAAGWQVESFPVPPLRGRAETRLTKPGTGPFGLWFADQRAAYVAAARRILRRHGFVRVPVQRLTHRDLV